MYDEKHNCVVIRGTVADRVTLKPAPTAHDGYGIRTIIEIVSESLRATVTDELWYVGEFRKQLVQLHSTLQGEAKLIGEGQFELVLRGNGRGAIAISVTAALRYDPEIRISFNSETDQSFLPPVIEAVDRVFLASPRQGTAVFYPKSTPWPGN